MIRFWTRQLWAIACLAAATGAARADFDAYIRRPEPAYRWESQSVQKVDGGAVAVLRLVSQVWQGNTWEHRLWLFRPDNARHPRFCTLYNTGGTQNREMEAFYARVAVSSGAPVAVLYVVPMQPLYGGKTEDALVVYTWQQFLTTGDESWPLHFPMAKAVIKAMDALQEYTRKSAGPALESFVITGASKRGWTTWLVGASRDARVKAIAPMVIDTLNLPEQLKDQIATYGSGGSSQIGDYADGGMLSALATDRGKRLIELEDPYSYRQRYTMPKLILLGTNDPYWPQGALNHYWDGLPGPKWVLYAPNSGHGLDDRVRVGASLAAFVDHVASGRRWPRIQWSYSDGPSPALTVTSDIAPKSARLFQATAPAKDFRPSKWSSTEVTVGKGPVKMTLPPITSGSVSNFGELTYELGGHTFTLSTQVKVRSAGAP